MVLFMKTEIASFSAFFQRLCILKDLMGYKQNLIQLLLDMERQANQQEPTSQDSLRVRIFIASCTKIQASSICIQTSMQEGNGAWKGVNTSKVVQVKNKKADFPEPIYLDYLFQVRQYLSFKVYDSSKQEKALIGTSGTTIGGLFKAGAKGLTKCIANKDGEQNGQIHLICQKVQKGVNKSVQFDLLTQKLQVGSSFCFGQNESHWKLFALKNNTEQMIYESQLKRGQSNRYQRFAITEAKLCNYDPKLPLIIRFYLNTSSDIIGEVRFDLLTLTSGKFMHNLTNNGQQKGKVIFQNFKNYVFYNFTEYISAGLEVSMVVGIDFTAKNGLPSDPNSLHHFSQNKKNKYEQALQSVCGIVLDYDSDKKVPCYGFGAKVKMPNLNSNDQVNHCFPLNGSQNDPNLSQLTGIQEGYKKCLPNLQFSGPTLFAPLLKKAMSDCQKMKQSYMILLILTNGVIDDKEQVKDLLVKCGKLPLSVIIIGIGDGNWSAMQELDDNDMQMTDKQGNKTIRDLVQFVEFQRFNNNGAELASQVLYELPRQVAQYHELNNLTPDAYKKK